MNKVWVEFQRTETFLAVTYGWRKGTRCLVDLATAKGWESSGLAKILSPPESAMMGPAENAMQAAPVHKGRRRVKDATD